jgi:hypothetical protein
VTAMIDSGAQGNFIKPRVVNQLRLRWRSKEEPYQLVNVEGRPVIHGNGKVRKEITPVRMKWQEHEEYITLDITEIGRNDIILGIPWLRKWNPRIDWTTGQLCLDQPTQGTARTGQREKRSLASGQRHEKTPKQAQPTLTKESTSKDTRCNTAGLERIPREYRQYEQLFREQPDDEALPEHGPWDHEIPLQEGKQPTFQKIYPLNGIQRTALKEWLETSLRKGHIRPSTSPAGYPILFVPKKNGKLRLCIDYRKLNEITIKNRYPLPLISEIRDRLYGAEWFTALDLRGAYNLIRIKEGDEWKTAFRTPLGHFETLVMPFGLTNAPASFQTMIDHVLRKHIGRTAMVYLDDILIYSRTLEEHKGHVHQILRKLQDAKLLIDPEKCEFHARKVDFLGFTIEPGIVRMQESKLAAIRDWPTPKNVREVRSFLAYTNFYRRFVKGYSGIAIPLTELTKKNVAFKWEERQEQAFEGLKQVILKEPILAIPDPEKQFEVETDASDYAIGGQLGQRDDKGRLHPIAFFSKKLNGPELNYQIHDKELMAIIEAFKEWKPHLSGTTHQVQVYTDHKNLTYFATTKELNKRQTRWAEFLSEFNYRIIYRKGSENGRADALSRRPDHEEEKKPEFQTIFQINENGDLEPSPTARELGAGERRNFAQYQLARDPTIFYGVDTEVRIPPEERVILEKDNGGKVWKYHNKIYVQKERQHQCVRSIHEKPENGHPGIKSTIRLVQKTYDFPRLYDVVREVIRTCQKCQQNKPSRHKPYGELRPLPVPGRAWGTIAFDHIVKLPSSEEPMTGVKYDSIFVITDKLTKYGYFIPYKESSSASDLAYAFLRVVVANHGLPDQIVSDRGTTFASKFWGCLMAQLGVARKLSTAYHPETNGQTERLNQTLEQYLRHYVNYQQDDWVKWLPLAQFAYNSQATETTKCSPFFANYGFEPEISRPTNNGPEVPQAFRQVKELKALHEELKKELEFVRERMSKYANQGRLKGPTFTEGSKVYLLRKNIKTRRPSDKLDHKKLGPFRVKKVVSDVNYELDLPPTMKIHPIFHISLLEPAAGTAELREPVEVDPVEGEYEVEAILSSRRKGRTTEYLVKWLNYDETENTWEPLKHLTHCPELLAQYHQQNPEGPTKRPQERRDPALTSPSRYHLRPRAPEGY